MLFLLYGAALRRSELSALDYGSVGNGLGILTIADDALKIELLKSKTSQDQSQVVVVMRDANPRGFAVLERWLKLAEITAGTPVLRRIAPKGGVTPHSIAGDGICTALKKRIARYHLSTGADEATAERLAAPFSGHSGRVGFVTAAKEAGAED